jgi:hypothetical protein
MTLHFALFSDSDPVHGHETNLEVRMSPSVWEDLNFSLKIVLKDLEVLSSAKGFTPIALMQWEILDELLITPPKTMENPSQDDQEYRRSKKDWGSSRL